MLGTLSLIALFALGLWQYSFLVLFPFSVVNGFIGLHFPEGKAAVLAERGQYWSSFLFSLPLQLLFCSIVFGIGYGIGNFIQ